MRPEEIGPELKAFAQWENRPAMFVEVFRLRRAGQKLSTGERWPGEPISGWLHIWRQPGRRVAAITASRHRDPTTPSLLALDPAEVLEFQGDRMLVGGTALEEEIVPGRMFKPKVPTAQVWAVRIILPEGVDPDPNWPDR